jgi:hypothetical protein
MATEVKTRKPNMIDVTVEWDGITAPEVTIPQDNFQWTLNVNINGVVTSVEYDGPRPKR